MPARITTRLYRRFVIKYFGSARVFIVWLLAVICTIFVIDTYFLTDDTIKFLIRRSGSITESKSKSETDDDKKDNREEVKLICGLKTECPVNQHSYQLISGFAEDEAPYICFDGKEVVTEQKKNYGRGLTIVVINDKSMHVMDVQTFDLYNTESLLLRYLATAVEIGHIVLGVTSDDSSNSLKDMGKAALRRLGLTVFDKISFRENAIFIGQMGLERGKALETHISKSATEDFGDIAEAKGCVTFPLGNISAETSSKFTLSEEKLARIKVGESEKNCGVSKNCGRNGVSVHLYTGLQNKNKPKICVNGRYVMADGVNDAGRGINIAVLDSKTKEVVRVGRFDTYATKSSNLELFLEMISDDEIVLLVTHDDSSKQLSGHARTLLSEIGSGLIQNLKFRDVWILIGQKGISGFSDFEQIEYAGSDWPKPIDAKFCIPLKLKGNEIKADPVAAKNDRKRAFCAKYTGFGDFCDGLHLDDPLTVAPITDDLAEGLSIFKVPIVVIPGMNHNALRMQLETLLMNPGLQKNSVMVAVDEKNDQQLALIELFGYRSTKIPSTTKYSDFMIKSLEYAWTSHPSANHIIILEEDVIPTQDFLHLFSQCLHVLNDDEALSGISAWNENGYDTVSSLPSAIYRVRMFPGFGFLLKRSVYENFLKTNLTHCCSNRTWNGWLNGGPDNMEMLVPDVSRVYHRPAEGVSDQVLLLQELFNRKRSTHMYVSALIMHVCDTIT